MKDERKRELITNYVTCQKYALYRMAYMYMKNEQDALDVVQEAICKALTSAHQLKDETAIKTWFNRIIVHTAIDLLRKNKRWIVVEDEWLEGSAGHNLDTYEHIDLQKAMVHLNAEERMLITLRYFEDMKIQEVAEVIDLNLNTTKTKLYKVLKKLKLWME